MKNFSLIVCIKLIDEEVGNKSLISKFTRRDQQGKNITIKNVQKIWVGNLLDGEKQQGNKYTIYAQKC
jgi:hypothetical protein